MNDLERKIRKILEGHEDQQEPEDSGSAPSATLNDSQALAFTPPSFALNDNQALARALGADTLDGKTF